jgi:hypothetical protein
MEEKNTSNKLIENRADSRNILNQFYSVQFAVNDRGPAYLFKLRDISSKGMCILVKEDSFVLKQLQVGDILNMKFNQSEPLNSSTSLKTQITSKYPHYHIPGHFLVELSIVEGHETQFACNS